MKATAIFCDGPQPDVDSEGEEIPVWFVFAGDDNGDEVGTVYKCFSCEGAKALAAKMSGDRRLPLEDDASPA